MMQSPEIRPSIHLLLALLLSCLVSSSALAVEVPALKGRVNDYAGLLSGATISQLDTVLVNLETTDSTQIVVLTIPSLDGDSLEDFSLRVAEKWKIGRLKIDNGALLIIARDERKLRIEVGYGLEGVLTDSVSGQIIRNIITPHFRQGNFDQGVIDGVGAMIATVKGEYLPPAARQKPGKGGGGDLGGLITSLVFIFFFFGSMFRKNKLFAAAIGGLFSPLAGFFLFGMSGLALLALVFIGLVGGLVASSMASSSTGRNSGSRSGGFYIPTGGGFGGSSGGFGGFSGGGGGFGGGGASGGW
jgi:uncharacterized protein